MPNSGHRWTPEEERAAALLDYPAFAQRYPGITRAAWRIRRNAVLKAPETAASTDPLKCKVCKFLAGIPADELPQWKQDLAAPVTGTGKVSHRAVETALRGAGVSVEESSIRRHRRNHIG